MTAEIAAVVGADGWTGLLDEPGEIIVYRRTAEGWETNRMMPVSLDQCRGLREMRQKMAEIVEFLDTCRIFMAGAAGGALYFELEKAGCNIWEIVGKPAEFLDSVLQEEENAALAAEEPAEPGIPAPEERRPGEYFISIRDVQGKLPGITSKQILARFIADGQFRVLEILCDHVPPWIEMEAKIRGYGMEATKQRPNEIIVRVTADATG